MAFPTGWNRRAPLVIQSSLVSALLSDFPLLLTKDTLPSEMLDADGASPAQNGGGDIRFSSDEAGTTQLACEVVSFVTNNDPALGSAEIWVKVPSVSASVDTTIYVWYNTTGTDSQPAVTDTYGRNAVWPDYLAVYHLSDRNDSTGNGRNLEVFAGTPTENQEGQLGRAIYLASGDIFYVPEWYPVLGSAQRAIMAWINAPAATTNHVLGWGNSAVDGNRWAVIAQSSKVRVQVSGGTLYSTNTVTNGTWKSFVVMHPPGQTNVTQTIFYIDGTLEASTSPAARTLNTANTGQSFRIGSNVQDTPANQAYYDEVRVAAINFSGAYIGASFSNQNDPATFVIEGTPVNPLIITDVQPRLVLNAQPDILTTGELFGPDPAEYGEDFVMEVDTTLTGQAPAGQIYIRLTMYDAIPPDVYINWGDGTPEDHYTTIGLKYHAYAPPGQYTVRMRGTLHSISSSGYGLPWTTKVISIGNLGWRSMQRMFNLMPVGSSVPEVVIPSTLTQNYFASCFADSHVNTPINWDFKSLGYTDLSNLFYEALLFNQDINHWDVSSVTNFYACFSWSYGFNQPLNNWNVSNVSDMTRMFRRAEVFDQDIGMWPLRIAGVTMTSMFDASTSLGMSPENYARTLIGWSNYVNTNNGPINVPLGAAIVKYGDTYVPGGTYFDAQGARDHLTATRGWTITDAGWEQVAAVGQSSELLRTYDTTLGDGTNTITIPIGAAGSKRVYWGDDTFNDYTTETTASRTYAAPGTYLTRTRGTGLSKPFNGSQSATKLVDCHSYGLGLGVTDISGLFFGAASFNQPLNAWDVSNATKAQLLFRAASTFNQPLNAWNVSNVNDMAQMFLGAAAFNQPLDNWDVSQVTNMESVFDNAVAFDQDIGMWPLHLSNNLGTTVFYDALYANGVWVMVGASGTLVTATNPEGPWTPRTSNFGTSNIYTIAYAEGVWVIGGLSGKLATATDPTGTWTLRTSGFGTTAIFDITYGNGLWVAVGATAKVATTASPQGSWTIRTPTFTSYQTNTLYAIQYGNGIWVVGGINSAFHTTADPTGTGTWTTRSSPVNGTLNRLAYENGTWVAVGVSGRIATATDPTASWAMQTMAGSFDLHALVYGGTVWVAAGSGGAVWVAADPTGAWSPAQGAFSNVTGRCLAFGDTKFLLSGVSANTHISVDPVAAWTLFAGRTRLNWMLDSCGMSVENYSRTLIGWANYVSANGRPFNVTLGAVSKTYNNTAYVTGQAYNDAAAARAYLTTATGSGGAGWTITDGGQV